MGKPRSAVMSDNVGQRPDHPAAAAGLSRRLGPGVLEAIIATAGRAPSVHNTQPWRFRVTDSAIEIYADSSRQLGVLDPSGRELFISCGAALFGLRLAVRHAGFRPVVESLPRWPRLDLVARVHVGAAVDAGPDERQLHAAVCRRHTHRGPFAPEPLPIGLLVALQRDAAAEGTTLLVLGDRALERVGDLVAAADEAQARNPALIEETAAWIHREGADDGVPARAFATRPAGTHRFRQRDFDQHRGIGRLATGAEPAAATVALLSAGDRPADWLRAGQALHRVLLRAATRWVFGSLHTQPLEVASIREALRAHLGAAGVPQMLMQLGRAHTAPLTWRRQVNDMVSWD
jgi:nitroreductase